MPVIIEFETPDGPIAIEAEEAPYGRTANMFTPTARAESASDRVLQATETFDAALGRIKAAANSFSRVLGDLDAKPDSARVEMALKFSAESGVVIAHAGAEAQIKVALIWSSDKGDDDKADREGDK